MKKILNKYLIEIGIAVLFSACVAAIVVINNPVTVNKAVPVKDSLPAIGIDSAKVDSLTVDTIK